MRAFFVFMQKTIQPNVFDILEQPYYHPFGYDFAGIIIKFCFNWIF